MKYLSILALLVFAVIGCSDRNPVASYNGGEIRRSDLKEAMRPYDEGRQANIVGNMEAQKNEIRALAERKLLVAEAYKRGIDRSPEFKRLLITEMGTRKRSIYQSSIHTPRIRLTGADMKRISVGYVTGAVFAPIGMYMPKDVREQTHRMMQAGISNMRARGQSNFGAAGPFPPEWRVFPQIDPRDYYSFDPEIAPVIESMREGDIRFIDTSYGHMAITLYAKYARDTNIAHAMRHDPYGREQYRLQKAGWVQRAEEQRLMHAKEIRRSYGMITNTPRPDTVLAAYRDYTFTYSDLRALLAQMSPQADAMDMQREEYRAVTNSWLLQCGLIEQELSRAVLTRHYAGLWIDNHPSIRHERVAIRERALADTLLASVRSNAARQADSSARALRDFYESKKLTRYIDPRAGTMPIAQRSAYVLAFDAVSNRVHADVIADAADRAVEALTRSLTEQAALHFFVENFLTAVPHPAPKVREQRTPPRENTPPAPVSTQKKPQANPMSVFIDAVILGGRTGISSRAYRDLVRAYAKLESAAADRRAAFSPSVTNAIERADRALVRAYRMGTPESAFAVKAFEFYFDHDDTFRATQWIARIADVPNFELTVITDLLSVGGEKRAVVIDGMGYINDPRIFPLLEPMLAAAKDDQEKMMIIDSLGRLRDYRAVKPLEKYLYSTKEIWGVRVLALEALKSITGASYTNIDLTPR